MMITKQASSYITHEQPSIASGPLPHNYRIEPIGECVLIQKYDGRSWTTLLDMPDAKLAGKEIRRRAGLSEISQATIAKYMRWANQINGWIIAHIRERGVFPLMPGQEDRCLLLASYDASWQELAILSSQLGEGGIAHYPLSRLPEPIFQAAGILDY